MYFAKQFWHHGKKRTTRKGEKEGRREGGKEGGRAGRRVPPTIMDKVLLAAPSGPPLTGASR